MFEQKFENTLHLKELFSRVRSKKEFLIIKVHLFIRQEIDSRRYHKESRKKFVYLKYLSR